MKLMIFATPVDGRDEEYNRWYDDIHLPEVLQVPGIKSGARYRAQAVGKREPEYRYLTVLEVEDAGDALREIGARSGDGRFQLSDTVDPQRTKITVWEEM